MNYLESEILHLVNISHYYYYCYGYPCLLPVRRIYMCDRYVTSKDILKTNENKS